MRRKTFISIAEKLIVFKGSNVRNTPTKRTKQAIVKRENSCGHILHSGIIYALDIPDDDRLSLICFGESLYMYILKDDGINPLTDSAESLLCPLFIALLNDKDEL